MIDVILYCVLSLVALYAIYRADPEHSEGQYTSIWSFYRSVFFCKEKDHCGVIEKTLLMNLQKVGAQL